MFPRAPSRYKLPSLEELQIPEASGWRRWGTQRGRGASAVNCPAPEPFHVSVDHLRGPQLLPVSALPEAFLGHPAPCIALVAHCTRYLRCPLRLGTIQLDSPSVDSGGL